MSTTDQGAAWTSQDPGKRDRMVLYIVVGFILVVLAVIASVAFQSGKDDSEAQDNAQQLITVLQDAGYPAPDEQAIIDVLGNDGGAVCENPGEALAKATLYSQITNGATGPGMRPVIGDADILRGQIAIMQIYCPNELPDVQSYINDLETGDVVNQ